MFDLTVKRRKVIFSEESSAKFTMNIAVFFFASWSKDTELSHTSLDMSDEDVHSKITIITVLKFALDNAKLAQITLIWLNDDDFITLSMSQTWNRSVQIGCNQWCPRQRSNSKANQLPLQQFKPVYEFQPGWNFHPHHQRVEMGTVTSFDENNKTKFKRRSVSSGLENFQDHSRL